MTPPRNIARCLSELTEDSSRNRLIVGDIIKEASNGGGVCLVLSDRKEHCHALQDMLSKRDMRRRCPYRDLSVMENVRPLWNA